MKCSATLFVVLVFAAVGCGGGSSSDRIVFGSGSVYDSDGTFYDSEISVMNADGTGVRQLTDNDNWDWDPRWSPNGKKIVFRSDRDGDSEIFVMNADGTKVIQLTDNAHVNVLTRTYWSPDGTRIAFASPRCRASEIFVMNADGTNVSQLTNDNSGEGLLSWSPDGKRIAFASRRYGESEIFVMNADGTNTYSTGQKGWSPRFGG